MTERRIMIQRAGFACIPAETDEEAFEKLEALNENDFDWESVRGCLDDAEIVEILVDGESFPPVFDESPIPETEQSLPEAEQAVPETKQNLHDSMELSGGYVLLPVSAELTDDDYNALDDEDDIPVMYAAVSRDSLKRYLGESTTDEELDHWLYDESTREDTDNAYGFALLDDSVAFTWDELRDEPFEVVGITSYQAMQAAMDFISGKMQEQGYSDASKWLDCLFDL